MKYELLESLGLDDVRHCNKAFGSDITTDAAALAKGQTIELPDNVAEYLTRDKGYTALLAPAGKVKAEAKTPELKGA